MLTFSSKSPQKRLPSAAAYASVRAAERPLIRIPAMTPTFSQSRPRLRSALLAALAALLLLPAVGGCSKNSSKEEAASGTGPVIARVNGIDIRESDLVLAEEDLGSEIQAAAPEARREQLISYLADMIIMVQAADKKNLADNPDFKRRLAFLRNKLLMGMQLQQEV